MSEKRTKRPSRSAERPRRGQADLVRLRRMSEREVAATSPDELANLPSDSRMNAVLRTYVTHARKRKTRAGAA